mmetsp:Transcript_14853/g.27849  ORF Transcript_14853/g.27849 Transcript_14853/m.27849 type:complete len:110 (+) Transcript_14853:57-386(+)
MGCGASAKVHDATLIEFKNLQKANQEAARQADRPKPKKKKAACIIADADDFDLDADIGLSQLNTASKGWDSDSMSSGSESLSSFRQTSSTYHHPCTTVPEWQPLPVIPS